MSSRQLVGSYTDLNTLTCFLAGRVLVYHAVAAAGEPTQCLAVSDR